MRHRVRHRDRRTARHPHQREPVDAEALDDRLEIGQPGIEREVRDIPVRQAEAPFVVPDQRRELAQILEEVAPDGALPVVLKVAQPARDDDQRRAGSMSGVGEPDAVARAAEPDLLLAHARERGWSWSNRPGNHLAVSIRGPSSGPSPGTTTYRQGTLAA